MHLNKKKDVVDYAKECQKNIEQSKKIFHWWRDFFWGIGKRNIIPRLFFWLGDKSNNAADRRDKKSKRITDAIDALALKNEKPMKKWLEECNEEELLFRAMFGGHICGDHQVEKYIKALDGEEYKKTSQGGEEFLKK